MEDDLFVDDTLMLSILMHSGWTQFPGNIPFPGILLVAQQIDCDITGEAVSIM